MTCALVDFKHGLSLWSGSREDMEERMASLRRRCVALGASDDFHKHVRILAEGEDVDAAEMAHMVRTLMVPRRVAAREDS